MMESLIKNVEDVGLPKEQAKLMVTQTAFSAFSIAFINHDFSGLCENIASSVLKKHEFTKIINEAITANIKRSEELRILFNQENYKQSRE